MGGKRVQLKQHRWDTCEHLSATCWLQVIFDMIFRTCKTVSAVLALSKVEGKELRKGQKNKCRLLTDAKNTGHLLIIDRGKGVVLLDASG